MQSVPARAVASDRRLTLLAAIRPCERAVLAYSVYIALRGALRRTGSLSGLIVLVLATVLVVVLCQAEVKWPRRWSSIARHWLLLALILPAYWVLEWVSGAPLAALETLWLQWDRVLLDQIGLRAVIEAAGSFGPIVLESAYLSLYAIPPVSLGIVYAFAGRRFADRYLLTLLAGTLAAYALIPLVPVASPRTAFPEADLPAVMTIPRFINVWMLDHLDNAVTVFPSGHVAVAFSSAFGLLTVFRRRPLIWVPAFVMAALVYLATVYGRYHYFVDGLMSIAIATFVWRALDREDDLDRRA